MKSFVAALLSLAILSQTFINVGLGAYYQLNKQYITEKLCENRGNPKLHCNGQCYLTKQLKKAEEGATKSQAQLIKEKEEYVDRNLALSIKAHYPQHVTTEYRPYTSPLVIADCENALLKPPAV